MQTHQDPERLYLNSLPSDYTRKAYKVYLDKYLQTVGYKDASELLAKKPKEIENQIIEFIISLKERGSKYSTIVNYVHPIIGLCNIHEILINVNKINRFMPRYVRNKKTRGYSVEEIQKLLDIADERMRAVILILSSTGMRINGLAGLKISSLQSVNNDSMYQICVYENESEEYTVFCSSECRSKGIDPYLRMRERYGEEISSNANAPLIRDQFDRRDPFAAAHPKPTKSGLLTWKLVEMAEAAGIRTRIQLESGQKGPSQRKEIPITNGFRRHFSLTLVNAGVKAEHRFKLEGHALIANDPSYVHITPDQLLESYLIAHDDLLIDQSHKLRKKVEKLEIEKSKIDELAHELQQIKKSIGKR